MEGLATCHSYTCAQGVLRSSPFQLHAGAVHAQTHTGSKALPKNSKEHRCSVRLEAQGTMGEGDAGWRAC